MTYGLSSMRLGLALTSPLLASGAGEGAICPEDDLAVPSTKLSLKILQEAGVAEELVMQPHRHEPDERRPAIGFSSIGDEEINMPRRLHRPGRRGASHRPAGRS